MSNKLGDPAGCHYLVTTLTFYYSTVTDLTLSRSVHATELEPCCPDPFLLSSSECRAIHYGQCSSLLKLPTFAIVPPNCSFDGKVVKPSLVPKREDNTVRLSADVTNKIPPPRSESLDQDPCSSLDLLAANIEQNLKPFLNILSSCEATELSDGDQDESIGSLATSLQYHLGNFIAAVRQQQQTSNDKSNGEEGARCSSSETLHSSDIQKKFDTPMKASTRSFSDRIYKNDGSPVHKESQMENVWSSANLTNTGKTQGKSHRNDRILERMDSQLDSYERNKDKSANKITSKDKKSIYLNSPDDSLAKQREVMRILNKTESVKSTIHNNTDSVDSELLDSLISLMNVSLVDLEDSTQKKNHVHHGKTYLPNSKSVRNLEPRTRVTAPEVCNLRNAERNEDTELNSTQPHPPCRRKLNFGTEAATENSVFSNAQNSTSMSGKQNIINGEFDITSNEILSHVDWSIPEFHRRDSLAPVLPSVTDPKRIHPSAKYVQTPGNSDQQLVSATKSSVAERVLAFEKCPDWNIERSINSKEPNRKAAKEKDFLPPLPKKAKYSSRHALLENSVMQCERKPSQIPKFYHPNGLPLSPENFDTTLERLKNAFAFAKGKFTYETFHVITKACSLPLYWKMPLYLAVGSDKLNYVTTNRFLEFWKRMAKVYHDEPSRFVYILSRGQRTFLLPEDFRPMIQDIVDTHPGLTFLKDSKEFHSRYVDTVISRIYYDVNRSWSGKITALELRKSNFLQAVAELEEDDDINQMTDYFSYEHFYVIYCKFWKIDTDHDLLIDRRDLKHHNNGDISTRMIDRIFSGAVSREMLKTGHMRYTDFVWFLLAEEDKKHPRSIEYWFRCMDLNGDGFLSMYELEYFYDEQVRRMEAAGIEVLPFKDCLCQMLDIVRPKIPEKISLSDLKHCKLTTLFFDTFFNLGKYLEHEHRDPFASAKVGDSQTPEISDWCRYAEEEYNHLVTDDNYGYNDRYHGSGQYYCAENAAFTKPEFVSKVYSKSPERDDDDDYADSDADY